MLPHAHACCCGRLPPASCRTSSATELGHLGAALRFRLIGLLPFQWDGGADVSPGVPSGGARDRTCPLLHPYLPSCSLPTPAHDSWHHLPSKPPTLHILVTVCSWGNANEATMGNHRQWSKWPPGPCCLGTLSLFLLFNSETPLASHIQLSPAPHSLHPQGLYTVQYCFPTAAPLF